MKTRFFLSILSLAFCASAFAQVDVTATSGGFTVNGSDSGTGEYGYGSDYRLNAGNGYGASNSISLMPHYDSNAFNVNRSHLKFSANGNGMFQLPSDRLGNMTEAFDGESRIYNTWNAATFPQNPEHLFNAQVDVADPDNDAANIGIDIQQTPDPVATRTAGAYTHDWLDNSIYDQDNTVGSILLNKYLTPDISMTYTVPEYSFFRDDIHWMDGSTSASMDADVVLSGSWFNLGNNNHFYIFGSPFSTEQPRFDVGESMATKVVHENTVTYSFNIDGVEEGLYDGSYWSIPWHTFGYDAEISGLSFGQIEQEDREMNIRVVPEPMSFLAMGVGLAVLGLRRRAKK